MDDVKYVDGLRKQIDDYRAEEAHLRLKIDKLQKLWDVVITWRDEYKPLSKESLLQVDSVNLSLPELAEKCLEVVEYYEDEE